MECDWKDELSCNYICMNLINKNRIELFDIDYCLYGNVKQPQHWQP
jgi:hypothetical protein